MPRTSGPDWAARQIRRANTGWMRGKFDPELITQYWRFGWMPPVGDDDAVWVRCLVCLDVLPDDDRRMHRCDPSS